MVFLTTKTANDEQLWFLVRVVAGGTMVPHGLQKLFGMFGSPGLPALTAMFEQQAGLAPGLPFVVLVGTVELVGGIALTLGLLTRISALGCLGVLIGAIALVNAKAGFFWTKGGFEYPLMWALACLCFVVRGPGSWSVDAVIQRNRSAPAKN